MAAPVGNPQPPSATTRTTEVVIVATQHFLTDMPDGYTPGHLRALLDKIAPNVVLVEAAHNVPDPWRTAPYELSQVTRPWAAGRRVPVVPAGWDDPSYPARIAAMAADIARAGKADALTRLEQRFQAAFAADAAMCASMNGTAYIDQWRRYHAGLHDLCGGDTPWEQLNAKIAAQAIAGCRQHAGRRVAIVFGGAHAYFLTDRLSADAGLHVIPTETFFPLPISCVTSSRP